MTHLVHRGRENEMDQTPEAQDFDLTPHPRILPMLGEIVLHQWRCLSELIDNSVDAFIEGTRAGIDQPNPEISINVPTGRSHAARISVRDNGPGMDRETLEKAARAGWTSHDPINNLGLFGMGFNIATARLGRRTTVWTTRAGDAEWVGLQIDFERLTGQQHFVTPALSRPKQDAEQTGTEVLIENMKPEQLDWFAKGYNRSNVSKHLGRVYSSMIGPSKYPIGFRLLLNGNQVRPKLHCIWGGPSNEPRSVETSRHGTIDAFQSIDVRLGPRPFCKQCWNWLGAGQSSCPTCGTNETVVERERRVHGWLGIQRYLDRNDFGVDFIRNGRKIEVGNKDLFTWRDEDAGSEETEYPIDDPRDRGRIVGEIHLDHCRVPYTKDRFVREDAAWQEMVAIVRGEGPLRPEIAARIGAGENASPLFRLFQAFRRSNPHNRRAGGWSRILVVPENDLAQQMAKKFDSGEVEFQTDRKWWDLVHEAERSVLTGSGQGGDDDEVLGGDDDTDEGSEGGGTDGGEGTGQDEPPEATPSPVRSPIPSLSRDYLDDLTSQHFAVHAYSVTEQDPVLQECGAPWAMKRTAAGPWEFFADTAHRIFRSVTLTPMDALLNEVAWQAADFERGQDNGRTFGAILSSLRSKYATSSDLDPRSLTSEARAQLVDIARSVVGELTESDSRSYFDDLSPTMQDVIRVAMASRGVAKPQEAIDDGRYLEYAPLGEIANFIESHPEFFFDGSYWDNPYEDLDYGSTTATDEARRRTMSHFSALLADVVWLAQMTPEDLTASGRERVMRASLATALLARTAEVGEAS